MTVTCYFLNKDQFRAVDDRRIELARTRTDGKQGASLSEVTPPGAMWYAHWFYDPEDPEDRSRRDAALKAIADRTFGKPGFSFYLSRMYWQTWSERRPPICVLCPNGAEWCVDAKSSNGEGWSVTGVPPMISCSPSILVPGYHGYLGAHGAAPGVFTKDVDR